MTRFSQSGALSTRERERERRKKNKRRAKQRRREEIVAEKWQEDPIPRTPRTHAGKHGKNQYGPDCPGQLLIADCGWNKPVRIYDTAMNETRPPRGSFLAERPFPMGEIASRVEAGYRGDSNEPRTADCP